jgi:hypothetical protein
MRKIVLFLFVSVIAFSSTQAQQKWSDMTAEQAMAKVQGFREDNQKYLKETLGMSEDQLIDIDNVNVCYLAALERISAYGKDNATKEKWAKTATQARKAQLDMIMGADKSKQFQDYVIAKLKKAKEAAGK